MENTTLNLVHIFFFQSSVVYVQLHEKPMGWKGKFSTQNPKQTQKYPFLSRLMWWKAATELFGSIQSTSNGSG